MEGSNFNITNFNGSIILEKDNQKISISQADNSDIWFRTMNNETTIELRSDYMTWNEWQTFLVFENLIKLLFGHYYIYDIKNQYNLLPKDFINIENKTITWHSNNNDDNKIIFKHNGDSIKITMIKGKDDGYSGNFVMIKANSSKYKNYYQEFISFFKNLYNLEKDLIDLSPNKVKEKKL